MGAEGPVAEGRGSAEALPGLVGRERELGWLLGLVKGVRERGGALVVRGDAGIGKSVLLAAASAEAGRDGIRVFRTTAVESETRLPFAGLHQFLLPLLARLERLPEVQRHALEMALGLAPREVAPDLFLIGLATLGLVADVSAEGPVLFVVDDAQWIDSSSGTVLSFVARRLEMDPVLMWLAVRTGVASEFDGAGLQEYDVGGLSDEAAAALLDSRGHGLSAGIKRRILAEALGNPLALIELPTAARGVTSDVRSSQIGSLPLTARLERTFAAKLDGLDDDTQALVLAAALEDSEPAELLRAARAVRGPGVRGWDAVVAAGLGTLTPDRFRFRHPLVRSAVEQATPRDDRRAMHAALADVLADDLDRSIWHRAEATRGYDEVVAAALAAAAERAENRGANDAALAAIERSASLTHEARARALRLWQAAMLALELGRWQESSRLFAESQHAGLPPYEHAEATLWMETFSGTLSTGAAILDAVTRVVEGLVAQGDDHKALQALSRVAVRTYWQDLDDDTRRTATEVARSIDGPADDPSRLCFLANVDPIGNGRYVATQLSHMSPASIDSGIELLAVGVAAAAVWTDDLGLPFLRAAADRLRAEGKLQPLCITLGTEAWAHVHRGAVLPAVTAAAESGRLAVETSSTLYVPAAKLAEAVAMAHRGHDEAARVLIAETEEILLPLGATLLLPMVTLARGRVELAAGHYKDAYERLKRLFDPDDVAFHRYLRGHALADLVDAARSGDGDLELVRHLVDEWRQIATGVGAPYLHVQVSYGTAVLSPDDEAERLFSVAIASTPKGWETYAARTQLAYGEWLRRQRRAGDSRTPLREAAETFTALGQTAWAERALGELRASGEAARRRTPEAWAELTAQELQIAQLAARGLSNKDIGERLYISHRTAARHLYNIFPKLGITSRNQLRDALRPVSDF
ncbi:AAA family ATPase [Kribbella sp. NPDC058693]|uniref:helix-turn-helix transcriptional regulator n=1 Tax=Kribbella sp. NPDC058693 TaxID=3346602 RepID=UPI00364E55BA